jgi:hypothetical protein
MEQEINGHSYRFGKIDAMKQFHVVRRLAPALASVGLSLGRLKQLANVADLLGPAFEVIAKMSDEDSNYIIYTCLRAVSRKDGQGAGTGWMPLVPSSQDMLAYQDIELPEMLQLVMWVLRVNLEGFFKGLTDATPSVSS